MRSTSIVTSSAGLGGSAGVGAGWRSDLLLCFVREVVLDDEAPNAVIACGTVLTAAAEAVVLEVDIVVVDAVWLILLGMRLAPFRMETGRDGERERAAMALCKELDAGFDSDSDDGIVSSVSWNRSREGRACCGEL